MKENIWAGILEHNPGGKVAIPVPSDVISTAVFSDCKRYRYELHRRWGNEPYKPIMFLMMNPSTATEDLDDPTVRKCRTYASLWGYNHLMITNVMAYRATHPKDLFDVYDPVGTDNLKSICRLLEDYKPFLVCAWGKLHKNLSYAEDDVMRRIVDYSPHVLRLNKDGKPGHPLYLPNNIKPEKWSFL
jgi:hypothetical protein